MAKKKKKIRSNVKRLQLQQKRHPMSQKVYQKKLRIARRKDFFRNFARVIVILCIAFLVLFAGGNFMLKQKTGQTVFSCMKEARRIVEESTPEDFRYAQTSYIYSDDGTELTTLSEDIDATYLTYDQIPADVVHAFVAVEDRSFWENSGIDYKGIVRVLLNYVRTGGKVKEGASTITQQLARGRFLTNDKTIIRKINEIFIARELTKKYSKEQIMEFYCNTCCFANGIYGVEDAAQAYLHKSASELTLSETAYICSIPNRPEYYNPLKEPANAIKRRDKILGDMYECGYITKEEEKAATAETIQVAHVEEDETFYNYEVTYAINCTIRYFMKLDGFEFRYRFDSDEDYAYYTELYDEAYQQAKHRLYTGGYKVYTTMNLDAQRELQEILNENLAFSEEKTENDIYKLQGAMTVIDNETGKVVAMIGGRSQDEISKTYSLNRGYQGYAQPGSSFKPLAVYAPALDNGYGPSDSLKNINVKAAQKMTSAEIDKMSGGSMSLRNAVVRSENGCAYWLMNKLTPKVGLSYVHNMNFSKIMPEDYTLSSALGGLYYGTTTVEMANAYYTLQNHGEFTQTDCIASVIDTYGKEIYEAPESTVVYDSKAADTMTDILKGVITSGTARRMNWYASSSTEAAGKTGTTNDYKAGWFCGYTPYYSIAVWVGCDTPVTVNGLNGGTYPASIWKDAMLYMIQDKPAAKFELENGVVSNKKEMEEEVSGDEAEEVSPDEPDIEEPGIEEPEEDFIIPEIPGDGDDSGKPTPGEEPTQPETPTDPQDPVTPEPPAEEPTQPEEPATPEQPTGPTGESPTE